MDHVDPALQRLMQRDGDSSAIIDPEKNQQLMQRGFWKKADPNRDSRCSGAGILLAREKTSAFSFACQLDDVKWHSSVEQALVWYERLGSILDLLSQDK